MKKTKQLSFPFCLHKTFLYNKYLILKFRKNECREIYIKVEIVTLVLFTHIKTLTASFTSIPSVDVVHKRGTVPQSPWYGQQHLAAAFFFY